MGYLRQSKLTGLGMCVGKTISMITVVTRDSMPNCQIFLGFSDFTMAELYSGDGIRCSALMTGEPEEELKDTSLNAQIEFIAKDDKTPACPRLVRAPSDLEGKTIISACCGDRNAETGQRLLVLSLQDGSLANLWYDDRENGADVSALATGLAGKTITRAVMLDLMKTRYFERTPLMVSLKGGGAIPVFFEPRDPGDRGLDEELRSAFLKLWNDAMESPGYDKEKWDGFRDLLGVRGVRV